MHDDTELRAAIIHLLRQRNGTICPSEAARHVYPRGWRARMAATRTAGRRLAEKQLIVVLQKGEVVDPSNARGPIRYGRGPAFPKTL